MKNKKKDKREITIKRSEGYHQRVQYKVEVCDKIVDGKWLIHLDYKNQSLLQKGRKLDQNNMFVLVKGWKCTFKF